MKIRRAISAALMFAASVPFITIAGGEASTQEKRAAEFINDFRNGKALDPGEQVAGLLIGGRIEPASLGALARELASGSSDIRQNIVALLAKTGRELNASTSDKVPLIRDHDIIRTLLREGFSKSDGGADAAARVLQEQCMPSDLAAFRDVYRESFRLGHGDYLFIAAKAKTTSIKPYIEKMWNMPRWRNSAEDSKVVKMALAALGNTGMEDEFLDEVADAEKNLPPAPANPFYNVGNAKDGTELAKRLTWLGFIGTSRTLVEVCKYLRSPLKSYVPAVSERSVRYTAVDAIRYNFPDKKILVHPRSVEEWAAVESFCTEKLNAHFDGPTPELPMEVVYPSGHFRGSKR